MLEIVATEFRAKQIGITRHAFQCDSQQDLTHSATVERRRVDEIEPAFECDVHALQHFVERNVAKLCTERTRAEAEDREVQVSVAEAPGRDHWRMRGSARRMRKVARWTPASVNVPGDCSSR